MDGVPFEGGKGENHSLEIGSNSFIPGFEEKLIGITAGEERDLDLTFPEGYHAKDLAGQAVVFHVKCNEIKFEELPEVDDEFAQDNDFDTVADMRADAKERLHKGKETVAVNAFHDRLVNAAAANMSVEIPDSMIEAQMDSLVEEYSNYISSQGIPFEQYVKMMGGTVESFRETTRAAAVTQVRKDILLDAVAQAEGLSAAEEDIQSEIEALAKTYSMKAEEVEKYVDKEALAERIVRNKATAVITDSGVPVAPKPAEAKAEEPAAEE